MTETIEECAEYVWGMARDLASPSVSGTPLNSERNVKHIASVIKAYAKMHAEAEAVASEARKVGQLKQQATELRRQIGELKLALKSIDSAATEE